MKHTIIASLLGGIILLGSCTKTGPQGPAGRDGNANVLGSNPVAITQWTQTAGTNYWIASLADADITTNVVNTGLVEVYHQYGTEWSPLPDIIGTTSYVFNFYAGGVDIYYQESDGLLPTNPGSQTFRLVIIPSSARKANPNTNWKDYNATMAALKSSNIKPTTVDFK
jgi:hypothetical protein